MIETIFPDNEAHWLECRTKDITSTECAALFGISPYITKFELFHRKRKGEVVKIEANERMKWGTRLQDSIAQGVAEEEGWDVRRMPEYMRDTELRAGASFDFSIEQMNAMTASEVNYKQQQMKACGYKGILEVKNVDGLQFRDNWSEDDEGNIEAPLHIEIQVQHQLMVSGRQYAYIAALVGGNRLVLVKRTRDEGVIGRIRQAIKEFWNSIDLGIAPEPNFEKDADYIRQLYNFADPNKMADLRGHDNVLELAQEYRRLGQVSKEALEKKEGIKAQLLMLIGECEKGIGDGFKISAGIIGEADIAYTRKAYRDFRVTFAKVK